MCVCIIYERHPIRFNTSHASKHIIQYCMGTLYCVRLHEYSAFSSDPTSDLYSRLIWPVKWGLFTVFYFIFIFSVCTSGRNCSRELVIVKASFHFGDEMSALEDSSTNAYAILFLECPFFFNINICAAYFFASFQAISFLKLNFFFNIGRVRVHLRIQFIQKRYFFMNDPDLWNLKLKLVVLVK